MTGKSKASDSSGSFERESVVVLEVNAFSSQKREKRSSGMFGIDSHIRDVSRDNN